MWDSAEHGDWRIFERDFTDHNTLLPSWQPLTPNTPKEDLASIGMVLGVRYTFGWGKKPPPTSGKTDDKDDPPPPPPLSIFKIAVTVQDELSGTTIPNAEVALKDSRGNVAATGVANSFGAIEFSNLAPDDYTIEGIVYGITTTVERVDKSAFSVNPTVQKKIFYNDLRFILKGRVVNAGNPESYVVVNLTNTRTGAVIQDNSDGKGEFGFPLDKDSNYEIVGKKENRLSNIENSSTVGLRRSTTLFVDLELGVEDFDCGIETKLDITYGSAEEELNSSGKFELDKLIRYMKDHQSARVELLRIQTASENRSIIKN